ERGHDFYEEIVIISRIEGRFISAQLRFILDTWKRQNLSRNDLDFLAAGQTLSLTWQVQVGDGSTLSTVQDLTVTFTGTNDVPLIQVDTNDSAAAALTETNTTLLTNGTLSLEDLDRSNTVSVAVHSVVASGTTTGLGSNTTALLAMLAVNNPATVIGNAATTGTIDWAFNSGAEAFDYLAAGQTLTLTYTVRATDSNSPTNASDDQTVVITITGTNDAPAITAATITALDSAAMSASVALPRSIV
ncbi:MAG: hypothetical protein EBV64_13415, partial [Oxalobacteraceae bacterium]|nr:hypothetical protein [Oxalobacteraceae bacterium]